MLFSLSLSSIKTEDSVKELDSIASSFIQLSQTGELAASTNLSVNTVQLTAPAPIRADPLGGVRATNETGRSLERLKDIQMAHGCFVGIFCGKKKKKKDNIKIN